MDMLFGSAVRELLSWFAQGLGPARPELPWDTARVAAVQSTERPGEWLAARGSLPRMNHFVIGVRARRQRDGPTEPLPSGAFSKCTKSAALRAGWLLKPIVADGICGPDTMAYYLGLERTQASYSLVRGSMADFMMDKARSPQ